MSFAQTRSVQIYSLSTVCAVVAISVLIALQPNAIFVVMGLVAIAIAVVMVARFSFSLLILFLTISGIDLARRIVAYTAGEWSALGLLVIDAALIVTLISLYLRLLFGKYRQHSARWQLPSAFVLLLTLYVLWISVQLLNPYAPRLVLSLAAVREYLLPIPILLLAGYMLERWHPMDWHAAYKTVALVAVGVALLGVVQSFLMRTSVGGIVGALLVPAEHGVHSWYDYSVPLVSSVFASSKRFGRFLLLLHPFLWFYTERQGMNRMKFALSGIVFLGVILSGSRESVILLLASMFFLERWYRRWMHWLFTALIVSVPILYIMGDEVSWRLSFFFADAETWQSRFEYMILEPLRLTFSGTLLWGIGAGHYGQSAQLVGTSDQFLQGLSLGPLGSGATDSGLVKFLIDLGVIGVCLFFLLYGYLLIKASIVLVGQTDVLRRASAVAVISGVVLLLKAHTTLSDQMVQILFWFYAGALLIRQQRSHSELNLSAFAEIGQENEK